MELYAIDLVCLSSGFGLSLMIFWVVEAVYSVFTVFLRD